MKSNASPFGALLALIALLMSASVSLTAADYDRMIVFGDSLSDNGNLSAAVGPGLLVSRNYDPFRVTDGPTTSPATANTGVTVERLNAMLGLPPLIPSLLGGDNYAWAFATTQTSPFDAPTLRTPGTGSQVASYVASHPVASPNSLYVVWGGANDLLAAITPAQAVAAETFAIVNLTAQVGSLLSAGAQNIVWFNLPDLSLTPALASNPILGAGLHTASVQFRTDWSTSLQQLRLQFPTATLTGVDVFSTFNEIISDPSAFGFTNVTTPAQGLAVNPDEYLFWDSLHPTTRGHEVLAGVAARALQPVPVPVPEPSTYGTFGIVGLIIMVGLRRFTNR